MMGSMMGLTADMTDEGLAAGLKGMAGMMSQGNAKYTEKLYVRMGGVWVHGCTPSPSPSPYQIFAYAYTSTHTHSHSHSDIRQSQPCICVPT